MKNRSILFRKAATALLATAMLAGCSESRADRVSPSSIYLATAVGRVDSADEARHLVASVDGVIARVLVARGDKVRAGQVLMDVDCEPRRRDIAAREATAQSARAAAQRITDGARAGQVAAAIADRNAAASSLRDAEQRLSLVSGLIDRGFVSRRAVDAGTNDRDAAAAQFAAADARLADLKAGALPSEQAQANAESRAAHAAAEVASAMANQCQLISPIDGEVLQILHREGEFSGASQGRVLLIVGRLDGLIVRAEIGERDADLLRPGQLADVWVDGRTTRWRGTVANLASVMGRRSARSLDPTDRFDRDVREVQIRFDGEAPPPLVGLRVTVGVRR